MLAYLKGRVISQDQGGRIIVETGGVGYEIFIPADRSIRDSQEVELWIHSHIREDAFSLYGFFDEKEKEVFGVLLGISGIGPKVALTVLSSCSFEQLTQWIESENIESLCKLPKIGKKMAGQMILSLKGKWPSSSAVRKGERELKVDQEITSALLRLGFRSQEIKQVLSQMDGSKNTAEGLRQALFILQNL